MTRFHPFRARSAGLSLAETLRRLESHERVVSVALLGSTARDLAPWSDYDLLVETVDGPDFDVEFTYVDHRPTDVIFANQAHVRRLLSNGSSSKRDADVLRWLASSRIEFARTADLPALRELAIRQPGSGIAEPDIFFRWVEANFNLLKARRWLSSSEESYQLALEIHLFGVLHAALADYIACRGRPWEGEKNAVELLENEDPEFLEVLTAAMRAEPLAERLRLLRVVLEQAFEPVGPLWEPDETSGGWIRSVGNPRERSQWEELLQSKE